LRRGGSSAAQQHARIPCSASWRERPTFEGRIKMGEVRLLSVVCFQELARTLREVRRIAIACGFGDLLAKSLV
jgi:hypothetical protein